MELRMHKQILSGLVSLRSVQGRLVSVLLLLQLPAGLNMAWESHGVDNNSLVSALKRKWSGVSTACLH